MVTHTLRLLSGDDYSLIVRWKDSDGVEVPIDTAALQVRQRADDAEALIDLTTDLTIDGGEVTLTLDGDRTAEVFEAVGKNLAVWDLEATSDAGQVKTLVGGKFSVREDVTR